MDNQEQPNEDAQAEQQEGENPDEEDENNLPQNDVPDIIIEEISQLNNPEKALRQTAQKFKFPLTEEDEEDLAKLVMRFDESPEHMASLTLPQIGINKRAFVFKVEPEDDKQAFKKTLWLNPTYKTPPKALLDEDYELCHSLQVNGEYAAGPVFRFSHIYYRAYDWDGKINEGVAQGFPARVIQHSCDHLDGKLFVDFVSPERITPYPEFQKRYDENTLDTLQKGIDPETFQ